MNLQEKHLQEIPTAWDRGKLIVIPTDIREELSQASTKITKDYMKRFNIWMWKQNIVFKSSIEPLFGYIGNNKTYTIDELIEIFLNNENKQP